MNTVNDTYAPILNNPTIIATSKQICPSKKIRKFTLPKIFNYKISFHTFKLLKQSILQLAKSKKKRRNRCILVKLLHNYAVINTKHFVFTINFSGFVNITKLRKEEDIPKAITLFCSLMKISPVKYSYRIDNITASGAFGAIIPLHKIKKHISEFHSSEPLRFRFNPSYFCGGNIKFFKFGTIVLFESGSYTIVGPKTALQVEHVYKETKRILLPLLQTGETCDHTSSK